MRKTVRAIATMIGLSFRADWRLAAAVFVISPVTGATGALHSFFIKVVVDGVLHHDQARALTAVGLMAGSLAFTFFAALTGLRMSVVLQERTNFLVDQRLIELTAGIPGLEHHERPDYLDRLELLRTSRAALGNVVWAIVQNLSLVVQVVTTAVLLAGVHPLLLALPLFGLPSLIVTGRTQRTIEGIEEDTAEETRQALHLFDLATTPGPGKELRLFRLGPELMTRYRGLWTRVDAVRSRSRSRAAAWRIAGWLVFSAGYIGALVFVIDLAANGRATAGEVLMTVTLAAAVNDQVTGAAGQVAWVLNSLKVVDRYLWLVDHAADADRQTRTTTPVPAPERLQTGIELAGVGFRYPDTDEWVLRNVDLRLPAGSTVALVGDNGAGKSTLVKLLARFYGPTEGVIRVDGADLGDIPPDEWRTRLSAGFQDFARLELLAAETVGVGHLPDLDDRDAVTAALGRAGGLDVVAALPTGFDTQVGPSFAGGVDLSGGQWQKLALGRAMMREAPLLLLLDEPTAALDAET
ncbi:MAG: ATP-binding cassette, subfamily bacterial, partial [Actinomycetota bacterium]|nr:ATP-binding cassette, subfamily bacterial [Actinomycetota bacterium]